MKYFIFLRHGVYQQPKGMPSAHLPHALLNEGLSQSNYGSDLIQRLISKNNLWLNQTIYTSSLLRAFQTASVVKNKMTEFYNKDFTIVESDQLSERSLGNFSNLTVSQIEDLIKQDPRLGSLPDNWKSNSEFKLPALGSESLMEAGKRVLNFINDILDDVSDNLEVVIFVGHGASFRHAAHLMGLLSKNDIKKYSMHYADPLLFSYDENKWFKIDGQWKLRITEEKYD